MVDRPSLEVLELRRAPLALSQRSQSLLEALAKELYLPPEVVVQLALTHTLGSVQRHQQLHATLLREPAPDHKRGSDDV